jgi:hypothetical protein
VTNGLAVGRLFPVIAEAMPFAGPVPGNRSGISPGPILEGSIEVMTRYYPAWHDEQAWSRRPL